MDISVSVKLLLLYFILSSGMLLIVIMSAACIPDLLKALLLCLYAPDMK